MRFDAEYIVEDGKLFSVDKEPVDPSVFKQIDSVSLCEKPAMEVIAAADGFDISVPSESRIYKVLVPYKNVALFPEEYDESFLAMLRDMLKALEEDGCHAIIVPVVNDVVFKDSDNTSYFTAAMKHCARRIKDCTSVIGFEIPAGFAAYPDAALLEEYIDELSKKHQHYVFAGHQELVDFSGKVNFRGINVMFVY